MTFTATYASFRRFLLVTLPSRCFAKSIGGKVKTKCDRSNPCRSRRLCETPSSTLQTFLPCVRFIRSQVTDDRRAASICARVSSSCPPALSRRRRVHCRSGLHPHHSICSSTHVTLSIHPMRPRSDAGRNSDLQGPFVVAGVIIGIIPYVRDSVGMFLNLHTPTGTGGTQVYTPAKRH